jgi:hypothetical protein
MVPGELRCRQCGAIYGADNYCSTCFNTTGVRADGGGYRCLACNAPRERKPGTIVSDEKPLAIASPGLVRGFGWVVLGGFVVLAAGSLATIGGVTGGVLAVGFIAMGAGATRLMVRLARGRTVAVEARSRVTVEQAILDLALARGGTLTVTDVAMTLHVASAEAEKALDSLVDGSRVAAEVTPDGRIEYVFRELVAMAAPKVRVDVASAPLVEEEDVGAAAAERRERDGR